jgi:hypothetical protein
MTGSGRIARFCILCSVLALAAAPLFAQQPPDERIQQLESRLDELLRQAADLRREIDALKGAPATTPEPPAEDLTAVTTVTDAQPVVAQPVPVGGKALNPDISVIGTMIGAAGQPNEFEERSPLEFEEAELAMEAFIDPYAKGRFFLAFGPEGAEIEEAYAQFVTLPRGFTAKAGKLKATFGKANTWHTHTRPWADQPLMITHFFGEESLADHGISLSRSIANPWNAFVEATGEIYSGDAEGVFEREARNDLFYNAHLKMFRDISENSNIEVGTSWARGTIGSAGTSTMTGVDVTYRWKPLQQSIYKGFIARFEGLANRRDDFDDPLYGFYASADYQLARRWFAGLRVDRADRSLDGGTDRGLSATLTFWPSEFSQLRGQVRRTSYGGADTVTEFLLQLQFAIGAHGAHTF